MMDPLFAVVPISCTPFPQRTCWAAMHQDYAEHFVSTSAAKWPDETRAGEICVQQLLEGNKGHYGPLEHAQIVLNVGWFPHSVMQQARTHRVGVSFDVQCMSSDTVVKVVRPNGSVKKNLTIQQLHDLYSQGKKILIRSLDEEENRFVPNEVDAVIHSGVKKVFLINTDNGKSVKATAEHRVLTVDGWKEVKDLRVGDSILSNGHAAAHAPGTYQSKEWLEHRFSQGKSTREVAFEAGVQTQTVRKWSSMHGLKPERKTWNKGTSYRIDISVEERERRRRHCRALNASLVRKCGPDHPSWKEGLSTEARAYNWLKYERKNFLARAGRQCEECGCSHEKLHCHHLKSVRQFPDLATEASNIAVLCPSCHMQAHALVPSVGVIQSITEAGTCETYDIAMKAPHHNFVANGLVVHNSMRYTGKRICDAADGIIDLEEVFYLRPVGPYTSRDGKTYEYTEDERTFDLEECRVAATQYKIRIESGFSEEHARGLLPFDYRQHFVVSFTLRTLMHFLDLRAKLDAQLEIRQLCDMLMPQFRNWTPEIARWYEAKRLHKALLAP